MALVACPECGGKISTHAGACPSCGRPFLSEAEARQLKAATAAGAIRGTWRAFVFLVKLSLLLVVALVAGVMWLQYQQSH